MQPVTSEESSGVSTRESFEIEDDSLQSDSNLNALGVSLYGSKTIESIVYILGWYFFIINLHL